MADSLRDKQKQMAREMILQAAADLIVEGGLEALSIADVADRAGLSKRTVYNYFDGREALLVELGRWSDELTLELGGFLVPTGLDALPDMVAAVWRTWAAQGTVFQAITQIAAANSSGPSEDRVRRRTAIASAIGTVCPDLNPEQALELAAMFHAISSGPMYERLTAQDGLTVDRAGSLVGWVFTVLRDALENDNHPYQQEDQA